MDIIKHAACNASLGAPSDMQNTCAPLPVYQYETPDGPWQMSFWRPDAAELKVLNEGGMIGLHVRASGRQHPVVALNTVEREDRLVAAGGDGVVGD